MAIRMTLPTMIVLRTLYTQGEMYGLQIIRQTGLTSGATYPILSRLHKTGLVKVRNEKGNPDALRRPLRRYYQLTRAGTRHTEEIMSRLEKLSL